MLSNDNNQATWSAYHQMKFVSWHPKLIRVRGSLLSSCPLLIIECRLDIYAPATKTATAFLKTKFQDIGEKELGITAERDLVKHREVRKLLNPAFSAKAFKTRVPILHEHIDRFVDQIGKLGTTEKGVNIIQVGVTILNITSDTPRLTLLVVWLASLGSCRWFGIFTPVW